MKCACTPSTDLFALCVECYNRAWAAGTAVCERDRAKPWPDYDTSVDLAPDGRNIAYWNRSVIAPQMRQNAEITERTRPKKGG